MNFVFYVTGSLDIQRKCMILHRYLHIFSTAKSQGWRLAIDIKLPDTYHRQIHRTYESINLKTMSRI